MEIKEFIRLEDEVKQILIDNPETRNNDMLLYWTYCNKKFKENGVAMLGCYFEHLFKFKDELKNLKIHPYETVSRCRRKIQAQCSELASERAIRKMKKELEKDYKNYAKL